MLKTIRARYAKGRIEPVEPLVLDEGAELELTVTLPQSAGSSGGDPTLSTAGAWSIQLNCEEFEADVYKNRLRNMRPTVSL